MLAQRGIWGAVCSGGLLASALLAEPPSLKQQFADDFLVGAALGTEQVAGREPAALRLVARQCNSITSENLLKWESVHPQPNRFDFDAADRFVEFGHEHGMFVVGHTLIWHSQTPDWVFADEAGRPLGRAALLDRMRRHIHTVAGRYSSRVQGWDVVNEAVDDDGSLRGSKWQQIIGDDYIEKAFRFAHEADPQAELYYNDYNEWKPAKRRGIVRLVRRLQAQGIRIDGLGLQGHWGLNYPDLQKLEAMFCDYRRLDVKLIVSELDVTVLPLPHADPGAEIARRAEPREELDPYLDGLPDDKQQALAERYAELFRLLLEQRDVLERVTFWGVHDGQSWRNHWPVRGRTDYPLLFDRRLRPKPACQAVTELKSPSAR